MILAQGNADQGPLNAMLLRFQVMKQQTLAMALPRGDGESLPASVVKGMVHAWCVRGTFPAAVLHQVIANRATVSVFSRNTMPPRRSRKSSSFATKLVELSFAAPQVVAHRVARMALAGPSPSDRDKKEFDLMVAEKKLAFGQSWNAMAAQTVRANQEFAMSFFQSFWLPAGRKRSTGSLVSTAQRVAAGVLGKGIEPVHRKAVANAKRLASTKLR